MEKVLGQDERIRRAESIYERRQLENEIRRNMTVNVNNQNKSTRINRLILQCIICLLIYGMFYVIKMIPDIASKELMYRITDVLEYDINIKELYDNFSKYKIINTDVEKIQSNSKEKEEKVDDDDLQDNEAIEQNNVPEEETKEELSQMEADAQYIKTSYSMIKPLEGEITSRFGERNPSISTIPKNHTGVDIARAEGTVIISAIDGIVELVSSEGDLR